MNHDKPYFSKISGVKILSSWLIITPFVKKTSMGTRLCGIGFKFLWFFDGCWCAFNRNPQIFGASFTFSSFYIACTKKHFQMCSVRSFVLTIVNQIMVIKFILRMRIE